MNDKVTIQRLPTGVPGLDHLLGGGVSEFSFNLIAGAPGAGKTTLAHQIMFALAGPTRRALFFTVLGEPPLKMLRYQQQYAFFDVDKVNDSIRFVNLAAEVISGDFGRVLARIVEEVELYEPGLVFVDSFRSVVAASQRAPGGAMDLQEFLQHLGVQLTSWQATTFLIGEYHGTEADTNPVFTVADGIVWMSQSIDRNSVVRKIQVLKVRGQAPVAGLHTFRITDRGIQVFPRTLFHAPARPVSEDDAAPPSAARLSMGIPRLDEMMGGGLPGGHSLLVAGPSGSGKTMLATQFLAEGARCGEAGVIAAFEKSPSRSRSRMLDGLSAAGQVSVLDMRALDLSIDEALYGLAETIARMQAKRVVIDSLSGFELALAPTFREDFRESLYRIVTTLTELGATVLMTCELEDRYADLRFSPYGSAFLADAIIVQRYVELRGALKRIMAVVKVRNSAHADTFHLYEVAEQGLVIGKALDEYSGLLTGRPTSSVRGRRSGAH